jgi:hypothetical protein
MYQFLALIGASKKLEATLFMVSIELNMDWSECFIREGQVRAM